MENLGMPMIYTLVCALIEKLNQDNEERKTSEANEKERLEKLREEEELVCFSITYFCQNKLSLINFFLEKI